MRNNEISAVIGLNQLKRLNRNNKLRSRNFKLFLSQLDKDFFYTNYDLKGNSNYAFPIILKKPNFKLRDKLENIMQMYNIEFRRGNAGGGNQLRQPYLKKYVSHLDLKNFQNVEHVHHFGYYIGNFPSLKKKKIFQIASILNKICKTNYKNNKNI